MFSSICSFMHFPIYFIMGIPLFNLFRCRFWLGPSAIQLKLAAGRSAAGKSPSQAVQSRVPPLRVDGWDKRAFVPVSNKVEVCWFGFSSRECMAIGVIRSHELEILTSHGLNCADLFFRIHWWKLIRIGPACRAFLVCHFCTYNSLQCQTKRGYKIPSAKSSPNVPK